MVEVSSADRAGGFATALVDDPLAETPIAVVEKDDDVAERRGRFDLLVRDDDVSGAVTIEIRGGHVGCTDAAARVVGAGICAVRTRQLDRNAVVVAVGGYDVEDTVSVHVA